MCIKNIYKYQTKYFADSVEWCVDPQEFQHIFSCGTYQLDEEKSQEFQQRKGSIIVFSISVNEAATTETEVQKLFEQETDGILDQKWLRNVDAPLLAAATSSGGVDIYSWEKNHQLLSRHSMKIDPEDRENIALSLDWDSQKHKILLSDSKGCITLLDFSDKSSLNLVNRWNAHSYEAWTCCFHKNDTNIVLTGGDDSLCCIYDLRDLSKETHSIKSHEAGVTAFLTYESRPNIFCTGSYDEHLRVFDMRSLRRPLESINLKGGIWRLKANPFAEDLILCACMYHNFTVCSLTADGSPEIKATYNGDHNSICYGADWCPIKGKQEEYLFGSCSFYDCLLTLTRRRGGCSL
ncbi:diphthine methyltransferase homolog [Lutzomyia longipalpis]|uniref:methylated diphthine methylhydrolase n=1 Tax=Lutzomyia longipalpis TaxID=7200 RepID=A0A1B0CFH0_LUTLO|nr:diphthine methyltransferase homolog [Lutzomyia longipalpis]